jgi:hypothetical protein
MILPASILGVSSAVGMVFGGGLLLGRSIVSLAISIGMIYRLIQVARFTHALDVIVASRAVNILRSVGILLMCVGLLSALLILFVRPITLLIFHQAGDNGIGYFVVGVILYALTGAGWLGVIAFEIGRFLGNRKRND